MAVDKNAAFKRLEEVFAAGKDAEEDRIETVHVLIGVDPAAPRDLVLSVKDAFMPVSSAGILDIRLIDDLASDPAGIWDACVIVAGGSDENVERSAVGVGRHGNPVVVLAQSALDIPESLLEEPFSAFVATIAASNSRSLRHELSRWIIRASSKSTALAASFPFCRQVRVRELAQACAAQNAAIGFLNLLPGSDLPYITVNQAKMVLDIAAVYGLPFSVARVPELAGVLFAAVGYRGVARFLMGLIPGFGRILRGVTAYAGTMTTAEAISSYLALNDENEDDPVDVLRDKITERYESVSQRVSGIVRSLPIRRAGEEYDDEYDDEYDEDQVDERENAEEGAQPAEQQPAFSYVVYTGKKD